MRQFSENTFSYNEIPVIFRKTDYTILINFEHFKIATAGESAEAFADKKSYLQHLVEDAERKGYGATAVLCSEETPTGVMTWIDWRLLLLHAQERSVAAYDFVCRMVLRMTP